jgi:hypothetical protein
VLEKKLAQLPPGPLYWRIETFSTLGEAQAATDPTALAAEVSGKVSRRDRSRRVQPFRRAARKRIHDPRNACQNERDAEETRQLKAEERRPKTAIG